LKDVTKIISDKATRFLPVDMKDRLKSAFNRSTNSASGNSRADDVPDYGAIFNANRSPSSQKTAHFSGPLDQTQLAEPPSSATMRNPARQIAHEIEEAEVVVDGNDGSGEEPEWEAASLKTRKAEAYAEQRQATAAPEIGNDGPDYAAISRGNKAKATPSRPARSRFDASAFDRASAEGLSETEADSGKLERFRPVKAEEARTVSKKELKPAAKETFQPQPEIEPRLDAAAQKSKARFSGEFGATESVNLKVENRPDERAANGLAASVSSEQYARPESQPEAKPRGIEEQKATGFGYEAKPLQQPSGAYRAATEAVAARSATSERANLNLQKENPPMDAKGHESENGATIRTDGNGSVAAIAIERNSKFSGQLKFSGAIAIDGHVEGELVAERIVVHEGGVVNATIEGNTVVIAGNVKGDVYAHNELEILPSGIVHGSVTAPSINVRRGGRIEGRCAIGVPRSN